MDDFNFGDVNGLFLEVDDHDENDDDGKVKMMMLMKMTRTM